MPPQHHFEQQNIPKIIPRAAHCVAFFYLREVVMSNQNEGVFSGVIVTNGNLSLEERVTALEKQLTDMQAAMSCAMEVVATISVSDLEPATITKMAI